MVLRRPTCTRCESKLVMKVRHESSLGPLAADSTRRNHRVFRRYRCFQTFDANEDP